MLLFATAVNAIAEWSSFILHALHSRVSKRATVVTVPKYALIFIWSLKLWQDIFGQMSTGLFLCRCSFLRP